MLRLQLLPDYVFEGARVRRAIIICVVIFLIDVGITHWWVASTKYALANMTNQGEVAKGFETQTKDLEGKIAAVAAEVAPIDAKRDYMLALKDHGDIWPQKMRQVAPFIYNRVELLSARLTPEAVELSVRTKTTDDVARMLMQLKRGYAAGLFAPDSINVTGLTGWPNPTSPRGFGLAELKHITVPFEVGGLSPVGSNSRPGAPQGGQGGGMGAPGGAPGAPEAGGSPPDAGAMGGPGAPGGGGGGGGASNDTMRRAALAAYIKPSVDPPPQPYLQMNITARWAQPVAPIEGGGPGAAGGGAPGAPGGAPMGGEPGAPPADPGAPVTPPPA